MNFTYVQGDEVIIMTTRKDTQKYVNLINLPRVAMLVHDFPTLRGSEAVCSKDGFERTYSITLYGPVCLPVYSEQEERFRALHLANNPKSQGFIVGQNIAVLILCVQFARLCNSEDKVTTWSASGGA